MKMQVWITAIAAWTLTGAAHAQDDSGSSNGDSVSPDMRQEMEQQIGPDVSDVRAHTDSSAATLSDQLNTQAYTSGNDVHFGRNESGGNQSGNRLLAHELTHVVQQGGGPGGQQSRSSEEPSEEVEESDRRTEGRGNRRRGEQRDRKPD